MCGRQSEKYCLNTTRKNTVFHRQCLRNPISLIINGHLHAVKQPQDENIKVTNVYL